MHQQLDRALPHPPRAQRPSVEWMIGRTAKWKQRLCPKVAGHTPDHAARPAIHRITRAICPFRLSGKMRPKPLGRAKHQQRLAARWQAGIILRMKPTQNLQMRQGCRSGNISQGLRRNGNSRLQPRCDGLSVCHFNPTVIASCPARGCARYVPNMRSHMDSANP